MFLPASECFDVLIFEPSYFSSGSKGIENAEDEDDIAPAFSSMAANKSSGPLPKFTDIQSKRPAVIEIEDDATETLGSPSEPVDALAFGALPLPDIRDVVKRKKDTKTESPVDDDEEEEIKPKIKRSDIEGLKAVCLLSSLLHVLFILFCFAR